MIMTISSCIQWLLSYGLTNQFFLEEDLCYVQNQLLAALNMQTLDNAVTQVPDTFSLHQVLEIMLGAYTIEERDLMDSKIMGAMLPRPSEVQRRFKRLYDLSPEEATQDFYNFSLKSNYIRKDRTDKNLIWDHLSGYGNLQMTINLSKPEKDPKQIEAERHAPKLSYPKCLLCIENEGYHGRINHPARQNLRLIPMKLNNEEWFFQYSPYLYYNEHAIVLRKEHEPMKITTATFKRMLAFLEIFPHYFIGSNADLPIVGGSILSHDHYQAGKHTFPMAVAERTHTFTCKDFPDVNGYWVHWPMSVVRLRSQNTTGLIDAAERILNTWRSYEDKEVDIIAHSGETPHNTITPIARKSDGFYELDLVLRNNRTTDEHPDGLFHPHKEVHAIKKENIGLIEVMGLAILPPRLKDEIAGIKKWLEGDVLDEDQLLAIKKHQLMIKELQASAGEVSVEQAVGRLFEKALIHAGVFKKSPKGEQAFLRFMHAIGFEEGK